MKDFLLLNELFVSLSIESTIIYLKSGVILLLWTEVAKL